jgi:hypothetical protein
MSGAKLPERAESNDPFGSRIPAHHAPATGSRDLSQNRPKPSSFCAPFMVYWLLCLLTDEVSICKGAAGC